MKSERDMPSGGLQINRRVGESFYIFVDGMEIRVELRSVKPNSAKVSVIADRERVMIRREEQLRKEK